MKQQTIMGVAPPSYRSASGASVIEGRYAFRLADEKPATSLSLTDIRAGIFAATDDGLRALRDGRLDDVKRHLQTAQLLGRSLARIERLQERQRLDAIAAGGK